MIRADSAICMCMKHQHPKILPSRILPIWALMIIIFSASLSAESNMMKTLFDFVGPEPSEAWRATNDGVMGGRSEGGAVVSGDGMLFSGNLSLENNGGFSWIHSKGDLDLSNYAGVRMRVLGDGRTYQLRMQTDARYRVFGQVAFSKEFSTQAGEWLEIFVDFNELEQSWRGRQLSGYVFDPAEIERIGFMLADKREGPFRLTVQWIVAEE